MTAKPDDAADVVPAYGEGGPEAKSMEQAAKHPAPLPERGEAGPQVPDGALVEGHGTTEADVAENIAKAAIRRGAAPA